MPKDPLNKIVGLCIVCASRLVLNFLHADDLMMEEILYVGVMEQ